MEYKVHWEGYPSSQDSWEPEENLNNCEDFIQEYIMSTAKVSTCCKIKHGINKCVLKTSPLAICENRGKINTVHTFDQQREDLIILRKNKCIHVQVWVGKYVCKETMNNGKIEGVNSGTQHGTLYPGLLFSWGGLQKKRAWVRG